MKGTLITTLQELEKYPQDTYMSLTYNGKTLKRVQYMWMDEDDIVYYDCNNDHGYHFMPRSWFRSARTIPLPEEV